MGARWPRLVVLVLLIVVVAVGPSTAADPIRIGYLGPLTGIFAQAGKDMLSRSSRRTTRQRAGRSS